MPASFIVKDEDGNIIPGTPSFAMANAQIVFVPDNPYPFGKRIDIDLTSAITGTGGAPITEVISHFTVAAALTPPQLVSVDPSNNETDVETNAPIRVTFDKPVDPNTVTLS